MGNDAFLLDTSAILTLIEDEAGADRVEFVLREQPVFICWMSLLEVYYITHQERGKAEAEERFALLRGLPITLLWEIDDRTLILAGQMKANHRISLADALIAAYGLQHDAIILHKDPEFETLKEMVKLEALPYKNER